MNGEGVALIIPLIPFIVAFLSTSKWVLEKTLW
jgi:hypothetical protein